MYTLAFDTTGSKCSICLIKDRSFVSVFEQQMDYGQAEVLIPEIEKMLEEEKIKFSDLGLIAVCDGPGSFTGVRASISAARAFSLACPEIPVTGVSAFDAYLMDFSGDELAKKNVVIIETKREDFYVQYYDKKLAKMGAPMTAFYDDIIHFLSSHRVSLCGDGVERFLNKPSGLSLHAVKMQYNPPVDKLALIGLNKYQAKSTDFPKPVYLKAPDVCVKCK